MMKYSILSRRLNRGRVKYNHLPSVLAAPVADLKQNKSLFISVLFHKKKEFKDRAKVQTHTLSILCKNSLRNPISTHEILFPGNYACVSTQQTS